MDAVADSVISALVAISDLLILKP